MLEARRTTRLAEAHEEVKPMSPRAARPRRCSSTARASVEPDTRVAIDELLDLNRQLFSAPEDFNVHRKLAPQREKRVEVGPDDPIDWGQAEALAFASLLEDGVPLRLTGQDTVRGTFSQRHLVLHDAETGAEYAPIQHLQDAKAPFEIHNSPLSEAGGARLRVRLQRGGAGSARRCGRRSSATSSTPPR